MKHAARYVLIPVLMMFIVLAGCNIFGGQDELLPGSVEDLEELRAMIPVIEAGLMVAAPLADDAGTTQFTTLTYTPPTPQSADTYYLGGTPDGNGTVRFPYADGTFVEEIYGTAGNEAYLTLTPHATNASLYVVDLYIYPTLSTTVKNVYEQYLVDKDDLTWALVDDTGASAPLNYLENQTVYFDGRVQENSVEWTRYIDDTYYAIPAAGSRVPDSFTHAYYNYPIDPSLLEPAKVAAGTGAYSAKITSTISDQGVEIVEYYTDYDPDEDGLYEKFTMSYVDRSDTNRGLAIEEKTVRRFYQNDATGVRTLKARTESDISYAGLFSSSSIITEAVDITTSTSGAIVFESVIEAFKEDTESRLYSITTSLTETGEGTNKFSGTMVRIVPGRARPIRYSVTLDKDGLVIDGDMWFTGNGTLAGMSRKDFKDFVVDLGNNGQFTGKIKGGVIQGLYKRLNEEADVYLSLSALFGISGSKISVR